MMCALHLLDHVEDIDADHDVLIADPHDVRTRCMCTNLLPHEQW